MKKLILAGCCFFAMSMAEAQQNQGKIVYERISQVQIRINDDAHGDLSNLIPKSRTDKFELTFGNNQSLWKAAEEENVNDNVSGGDGVQIKMFVSGNDDVLFTNFETGKRIEKRELFEKTFIVEDTITKLKWKMTGETKTILGMPCMQATTSRISTRTMMNMDNGKMERKDVQDTSKIIVWFTNTIPVSAGPAEFQGQLPGLILEMDVSNGRQTFKAISIDQKADLASIKEPAGKKRLTPEEFRKERDKMMAEMQKNNSGGGNRTIRMQ